MTRTEFEARQIIGQWLSKHKIKPVGKLRHVHPRCYVIGYAAPGALIVAHPWMDSEQQTQAFDMKNPLTVVRRFDASLKPGDWCATAYVSTATYGEQVAVAWKKQFGVNDE
jgi:hypothetical protein